MLPIAAAVGKGLPRQQRLAHRRPLLLVGAHHPRHAAGWRGCQRCSGRRHHLCFTSRQVLCRVVWAGVQKSECGWRVIACNVDTSALPATGTHYVQAVAFLASQAELASSRESGRLVVTHPCRRIDCILHAPHDECVGCPVQPQLITDCRVGQGRMQEA